MTLKETIEKFFLNENEEIIGARLRDGYLCSHFPDFKNEIYEETKNLKASTSLKNRIFFILGKSHIKNCPACHQEFLSVDKKESFYCSRECALNDPELIKNRNNSISKAHSEFSEEKRNLINRKTKQTKLLLHGSENYQNIEKIKETNIKKYGVSTNLLLSEIHEKAIVNSQSPETKKKRQNTIKQKYNTLHPMQNEEIKRKVSDTKIRKYGKLSPDKIDLPLEKIKTMYLDENKTYQEIADHFGVAYSTIQLRIYELDIEPRRDHWQSAQERKIAEFLDNLNIEYKQNCYLVPKQELDIYIPEFKLGIEVNGLYYHSDLFKDKNYHKNKTKDHEKQGIEVLHFYSDEIENKFEIVKSIISSKLNKNKIIYARKCHIKELNFKEYKEFLDSNHIQGLVQAKDKLGLFHDDELVSVMSFGKSRFDKNKTELLRFCNKLNYNVIGGASKLFNYYIRNNDVSEIISYSDNRLFNGNMYEKLGFEFLKETDVGFYYTNGTEKFNRMKFQKHRLNELFEDYNDDNVDEFLKKKKIYKIYDCGQKVWFNKI